MVLSCKEGSNKKVQQQKEKPSPKQAYDYTGKYEGTLPCKNCDGVSMSLTLKNNQKFRMVKSFIGGSRNGNIKTKTGNYSWSKTDSIITLEVASKQKFLIEQRHLMMLDDSNRKMKNGGNLLMLSKVEDY